MDKEVQQQHLNNIIRGIEAVRNGVRGMDIKSFNEEEQIKEDVFFQLQTLGQNAYELATAADDADDLTFDTDILMSLRNARFNQIQEMDTNQVWGIIQSDLPLLHDRAIEAAAQLGREKDEKEGL